MSGVRVRFAPSPTGSLHVGSLRTALINHLFAQNQKGCMIIRVEDTDLTRSQDIYIREQLQDLKHMGFHWKEGLNPHTLKSEGPFAPYRQSQRLAIYKEYGEKLVQKGRAYYDDSPPSVKGEKNQPPPQAGTKPVLRFKNFSHKKIHTFEDQVRGKISLPSDMVGDFVLIRSSGLPVYNFCCAVDDHLMGISHVLRSEEHLPNTLRQLMIYEALNLKPPVFGHLSLILGQDRQKLSKRTGALSAGEYLKKGYLPEALLNFLALQGFNPKTTQEVFTLKELEGVFSLKGLNAAAAVFDEQKLRWINRQHLLRLDEEDLWEKLTAFFSDRNWQLPSEREWKKRVLFLIRESFSTFLEAEPLLSLLAQNQFVIKDSVKEVLHWPLSVKVLKAWESCLQTSSKGRWLDDGFFLSVVKKIKEQTGAKGKFLFMPIRCAVLAQPSGAELKQVVPLIPKEVLLNRVSLLLQHQKTTA